MGETNGQLQGANELLPDPYLATAGPIVRNWTSDFKFKYERYPTQNTYRTVLAERGEKEGGIQLSMPGQSNDKKKKKKKDKKKKKKKSSRREESTDAETVPMLGSTNDPDGLTEKQSFQVL